MSHSSSSSYDDVYDAFDSPLMQRVRAAAYGEDIGQHSWVNAADLRKDITRLRLTQHHHILDLGCGPCGPLTYLATTVRCRGTGVDASAAAVNVGRRRAAFLGVDDLVTVTAGDLDQPLSFPDASFDAAMSFDVVLHVRDRRALFREVARVLAPGGRFVLTDAGVLVGAISNHEVAARSVYGFSQFTAPGYTERALEEAGFRVLEIEERTESLLANAAGRLEARAAHRVDLLALEGESEYNRQTRYLETVVALGQRRSLSRAMYLAEADER